MAETMERSATHSQTMHPGVKPPLELSAHMTVRPGHLEGFKAQAAEMMRLVREQDTQTLRYDWYLRDDGTECEVREAYVSEEGLFEHVGHIREARDTLFRDFADDHLMTVYGTPSPQFLELAKAHGAAVRWFTFLHGRELSPTVLPELEPSPRSTSVAAEAGEA
jgi:quinol monooxygenase YgiN